MQIITLTLSPAFDVHCTCDSFAAFHENIATVTSRDAGGKGVNISRALAENGIENLAIIAMGKDNSADFSDRLASSNIKWIPLYRAGRIRENITRHSATQPETRISFAGFSADESLLSEAESCILSQTAEFQSTILTFTGRIPNGIATDAVKSFLKRLQAKGIKLVIDSKSFTREDILDIQPWLIKPNEEEVSLYANRVIKNNADLIEAAAELFQSGIANVMISLGKNGAILSCSAGTFCATVPKINVKSTIGAGDSSIAGFLVAYQSGKTASDCLRLSAAFGSAACLTDGTQPPNSADVSAIMDQIQIKQICN